MFVLQKRRDYPMHSNSRNGRLLVLERKNVKYLVNAWDVARSHFSCADEIKMFSEPSRASKLAIRQTSRRCCPFVEMKFLIFYPRVNLFRLVLSIHDAELFSPAANHQLFSILVHYSSEAGGINLSWNVRLRSGGGKNLHFIRSTPHHAAWCLIECDWFRIGKAPVAQPPRVIKTLK